MITVGSVLKQKRKFKNLSIQDVSDELKITTEIIMKIENDEVDNNADIIFYIGHLRSYSQILELDSNEIVISFKKQMSITNHTSNPKILKPSFKDNSFNFVKLFPPSLAIIIFSSFYFLFLRENNISYDYALVPDLPESYIPIIEKSSLDESNDNQENINIDNMVEKTNDFNFSSAVASNKNENKISSKTITLKLLNPTWIQVRDISDNIIISKLMEKDEVFSYKMNLNYNITAGNAGNVIVFFDNDAKGKMGKYGEIIDSYVIDNNFDK